MVGCCECGNEHSGSIKCGEFLDWLINWLASQRLCCMECVRQLVSYFDVQKEINCMLSK